EVVEHLLRRHRILVASRLEQPVEELRWPWSGEETHAPELGAHPLRDPRRDVGSFGVPKDEDRLNERLSGQRANRVDRVVDPCPLGHAAMCGRAVVLRFCLVLVVWHRPERLHPPTLHHHEVSPLQHGWVWFRKERGRDPSLAPYLLADRKQGKAVRALDEHHE